MRTATELQSAIGKIADYNKIDGVSFAVEIINTRERFGDVDYLIAPLSGSGSVWVSQWSVKNLR